MVEYPRIRLFGEGALLVELGPLPDLALNRRVHALAADLEANAPAELHALVPGYSSLLIEVDPLSTDLDWLAEQIHKRLSRVAEGPVAASRVRTIPMVFGGEYGPDLDHVARETGLPADAVVERLLSAALSVYMLGFAPGHPYLGDLPPGLAVPRLTTPRERVPAGSVAIVGRQMVIYTHETPGGWRLVGRTPRRLFDVQRHPPTYLAPGDVVRLEPIGAEEWERHAGAADDW